MGKFNFGDAPENEENKESASENNESETSATSKFSFCSTIFLTLASFCLK